MRIRIKNTSLTLKIISWLQIIGGVTGIWLMAYLMLQTETITGPLLLIFLIGLGLFTYSIYSGGRLLKDSDKSTGIILSIINQIFQLFQWSMFGFGLSYSSGAELVLGIEGVSFNFNFAAVMSNFNMSINNDNGFFIKINLLAVFIIIMLVDILAELKEKKQEEIESQEINIDELIIE
ncbi:MAG TPA: hypothetical protein VD908_08445 [Cytophagales bacterium]|nr:hypothetical protein [Cytophagales bacterium]